MSLVNGGDYVDGGDVSKIENLNAMTLTFWINLQATPPAFNSRIATKRDLNSPKYWDIELRSSREMLLWLGDANDGFGAKAPVVSAPIATGIQQWAFVALTYGYDGTSESTAQFWSGSLTDSVAASGSSATWSGEIGGIGDNIAPLRLGQSTWGQTTTAAWMDDVRIYDTVLSQSQLDGVRSRRYPSRLRWASWPWGPACWHAGGGSFSPGRK